MTGIVASSSFGTGQVLWSLLWLCLFVVWIWLLILVFSDIFRSRDLSGWAKALWVLFVIVLPYLGVFVYLIARGGSMGDRVAASAQAQDAAQRQYIQSVAATSSTPADQIARLADLKASGAITDAEFETGKARALGGA